MKLLYTLLLASASAAAVSAIDDGDTNIRGGEVQRRLPGNGNGLITIVTPAIVITLCLIQPPRVHLA